MKIRQSTLGDADACLRRMQYSIESTVYHGGSTRAVGTAYHAALELFYRSVMEKGEWVPLSDLIVHACTEFDRLAKMAPSHASEFEREPGKFTWDEKFPDHDTAYAALEHMITVYFDGGHAWPVLPLDESETCPEGKYRILGVELSFALPFGVHTKNGSIDLVLSDHLGWIIGDDQKTSGRKWATGKDSPRKQNQSNFYTDALMELFPGRPGYRFVFDIMTYKGDFERRVTDPTPESIQATRAKATQIVTLYEGMRSGGMDLPTNAASNLCNPKWCDYFDVCPSGSALER